jgi:hypothetical protein
VIIYISKKEKVYLANSLLIVQALFGQLFSVALHLQADNVLATHLNHLLRFGNLLLTINDKQWHNQQYSAKRVDGLGKFAIGCQLVRELLSLYELA